MSRKRLVRNVVLLVSVVALGLLWAGTWREIARPDVWPGSRARVLASAVVFTLLVPAGFYLAFGRASRRRRIGHVALGACSTLLSLLLVEAPTAVLGIDFQERFGTSFGDPWLQLSARGNRLDPELIHVHEPHSVFVGRVHGNLADLGVPDSPEYEVDVRYDRNGFRNDRDYERAEIAAIGDSFVEAALVPLDETVVKRLERTLEKPTVNLGQAAYGLRQELTVLKRYGLPLRPKLVLWFFFDGNDLRDVEAYEYARSHLEELEVARSLSSRLLTRNALLAAVRIAEPPLREPRVAARRQSGLFRRADGDWERVYFGQTNGPWTEKQWRVLTETLIEAKEATERAGARFVLVYISRKFRIYRDFLKLDAGSVLAGWETNDLPAVLAAWCRENGIEFVDTIPPMREAVARGDAPYFPDDVHWSSRGHEIAAEAILRDLESASGVGS